MNKETKYEIHFEEDGEEWRYTGYYDNKSYVSALKVALTLCKDRNKYNVNIVEINKKYEPVGLNDFERLKGELGL